MKKKFGFTLLVLLVLFPVIMSCGKEDLSDNDVEVEDDYYVKYEVQNGKQLSYASSTERDIVYKDVDHESYVTVVNSAWDGTYGPFKKGDQVYFKVTTSGKYSSTARLSVSKNREAFAIKSESRDNTNISLRYKIDF